MFVYYIGYCRRRRKLRCRRVALCEAIARLCTATVSWWGNCRPFGRVVCVHSRFRMWWNKHVEHLITMLTTACGVFVYALVTMVFYEYHVGAAISVGYRYDLRPNVPHNFLSRLLRSLIIQTCGSCVCVLGTAHCAVILLWYIARPSHMKCLHHRRWWGLLEWYDIDSSPTGRFVVLDGNYKSVWWKSHNRDQYVMVAPPHESFT